MRVVLFINSVKTFFWHRQVLADFLISERHDVIIVCPHDEDYALLENSKYKTVLVKLNRKGMNPFREFANLLKLMTVFSELKPDLCHNFTIKCVIYGSIAQRIVGINRIINTVTGLGYVFIKGGFLQWFVQWLYRFAFSFSKSQVIFQNRTDFQLFTDLKIVSTNRAHLISGSGVDTHLIQPSNFNDRRPAVLVGARLLKTKGILEILQASAKRNNHELWLAGDFDPSNPDSLTESDVAPFRKFSHIHFLGNTAIVPLLKEASIGCLPSYREGLPKFLLECAAAGLPIVTTDAPGCRDVIDGNGFLVPVGSIEPLFEKIQYLLGHPDEALRMGQRSRELAINQFNSEKIVRQITALYSAIDRHI